MKARTEASFPLTTSELRSMKKAPGSAWRLLQSIRRSGADDYLSYSFVGVGPLVEYWLEIAALPV